MCHVHMGQILQILTSYWIWMTWFERSLTKGRVVRRNGKRGRESGGGRQSGSGVGSLESGGMGN